MPRNDRSGAFLRLLTAAFVKSGIAGVKVSAVQLILDMTKGLAEAYKLDKNFPQILHSILMESLVA